MNRFLFSSLLLFLIVFLFGCSVGSSHLSVDNTEPVSDQNRIICQLDIGAFTPEGTISAALQQLDRLDTLGVDILWLMPVYPRGATLNSPSALMDFRQVNPAYGTVGDLKAFVAAAHERGVQVWLDWVTNHVAVDDTWVTDHPAEMIEAMNAAMKFWVSEADIDGFRCGYVSSPTTTVQYWHDIIRELKETKPALEFLNGTDITNPANHRFNPCGFDYDHACDFQSALACRFGSEQTQADSLRAICYELLRASQTVDNRRIVYLANRDQCLARGDSCLSKDDSDGGHTLKDCYGDNRYNFTVLLFTFYGMPLLCQSQEAGKADLKMHNTVRTLIALHHTQPALAADAPVVFLATSAPQVLAYRRGPVVVVLNLGKTDVRVNLSDIAAGSYDQWLNSATIAKEPSQTATTLAPDSPISLEAGGYRVYVSR